MGGLSVYVASPLGFTDAGRYYQNAVLGPRLAAVGVTVLDPWAYGSAVFGEISETGTAGSGAAGRLRQANLRVGKKNVKLIAECLAVLAVLDGADVDSGTAAEVGYAASLPRPVVGLRTDLRLAGDNVAAPVNLQLLYFIEMSGGRFETSLDGAVQALLEIGAV